MTLLPHADSLMVPFGLLLVDIRESFKIITGRPFEIGQVPANAGGQEDPNVPYGIIYPVPGGRYWGAPFADPNRHATYEVRFTSVGHRGDQAQKLADKVREIAIGRPPLPRGRDRAFLHDFIEIAYTHPSIPGNPRIPTYHVQTREPAGPPGGMDREDTIFSVSDSYFIEVEAL